MKVFVIAGEVSGDLIGAEICSELKQQKAEIFGVGGKFMLNSGLSESLFDISEISVMGFIEILPKIFKIKKLIIQTAKKILEINPDYVITVDSPGFNLRVVKLLRRANFKGKIYHAVAPTVWVYKENRTKLFAKLFDKLFCILPFEPPFFEKEGLEAKFICYPPLTRLTNEIEDAKNYQKEYVLFNLGSRSIEVSSNINFALQLTALIKLAIPETKFVFPTFDRFEEELKKNFPNDIIITEEKSKNYYIKRAKFAISKSGTGAMENSLFGIPSIVFYNGNAISLFIILAMVKVKMMHLINILLKREAVPEFIQARNNVKLVAEKIVEIMQNETLILLQKQAISEAKVMLNSSIYKSFGEGVVKNL